MRQKYIQLIKNSLVFAIGSLGSRIISFLLVPLYTNVLTTDQFGTADLVISCANMIVPIASLVIQDSVLRFAISNKSTQGTVIKNAYIVILSGAVFTFAMTPLTRFYSPLYEWRYYLAAICINNMISNVMLAYAKAIEKNKLYSIASIVSTTTLAIANIVFLVVLKMDVKGYLIANILSHTATSIMIIIFTGCVTTLKSFSFDPKLLRSMIVYSLPLILNNISWWVLHSSDRIMIQHYCSISELGLYTAASKIPAFLSIITTVFSQAWTISAIKEYDNDNDKGFYSNVFKLFSATMFVGASCIILITKTLMKVYVGDSFFSSWHYVPLLIVGTIYYSFSSFYGAIYNAHKMNINVATTTFVAAFVNILINLILMRYFGVIVAAISTAISYFVIGIFRMIDSSRFHTFHIDYFRFIIASIVVWVQACLVTLDFFPLITSSISVCIFTVIYFDIIVFVFRRLLGIIRKK